MKNAPQELHKIISISQQSISIRLDKALAESLTTYSRSAIQKLIQSGSVMIYGKIVTECSYQVKHPTEIEIKIKESHGISRALKSKAVQPVVVFEDSHVLVIEKPHGLIVHASSEHSTYFTLVDFLKEYCGNNLSNISGNLRPGIVHRLDANTSGLMIVAKNNESHATLSKYFFSKQVERKYMAIVYGVPSLYKGIITSNIERSKKNRAKMTIVKSGGRFAKTHYTIIKNYYDTISLLECVLETGRTHQIRIHMSYKNHPLVGDSAYMMSRNFNLSRLPQEAKTAITTMQRQALHSYCLRFPHPVTNEELCFESSLPEDMQNILDLLSAT